MTNTPHPMDGATIAAHSAEIDALRERREAAGAEAAELSDAFRNLVKLAATLSRQRDTARSRAQTIRQQREAARTDAANLRALLAEVAEWMDGLGLGDTDGAFCPCTSEAETAEELLPRLKAALSEGP